MAENLNVTRYQNREPIEHIRDNKGWINIRTGAYCNYYNDVVNTNTYGRLYNWYAISNLNNIASKGWRVPDNEDWEELELYLGVNPEHINLYNWRTINERDKLTHILNRILIMYKSINFEDKFSKFTELWTPKVIAEMNEYQFKLTKLQGEFVWHDHSDTDETFIVLNGSMSIEFRDGTVKLNSGEMFVVPKGVEHRPFSQDVCEVMIIEPKGVVNTGDQGGEMTAENNVWI